jgi:NADH:ubiquinone oxidoreductase subunit 3 (subunit A)
MMAGVIYVALSKNSTPKVRIAALIALGVMVLSLIVSLILIFMVGPAEPEAPFIPFTAPAEEPPDTGHNILALLSVILFLAVLFLVILVMALRENRKSERKRPEYEDPLQPPLN